MLSLLTNKSLNTFFYYVKKAKSMPLNVILIKITKLILLKSTFYCKWFLDKYFYKVSYYEIRRIDLGLNFKIDNDLLDTNFKLAISNYLDHNFDLLGSGWINVNKSNSTGNYKPINWHKDFKSGYNWNPKTWYKFISYGELEGVDVKVPWELARFQHLPQLAVYYSSLDEINFTEKKIIIQEFQNQVLDFVNNNPPRFGVNWSCTMDVGIRAANLVMAYEIFLSSGVQFSHEFATLFLNTLFQHGKHIVTNLEWSDTLTSNHYLANICGLLFIASIIDHKEADKWLYFSINEILSEFSKQFYSDGVNFESSTAYHRLSTEMIVYSSALILGSHESFYKRIKHTKFYNYTKSGKTKDVLTLENQRVLPEWFTERLFKALYFTHSIMKSNFEIPQVGDNDSGRFFKFSIPGQIISIDEAKSTYLNLKNYDSSSTLYLDENLLDHRSLSIALKSLFDFYTSYDSPLEDFIFRSLAKNKKFARKAEFVPEISVQNKSFNDIICNAKVELELPYTETYEYEFPISPISILQDLKIYPYKVSGFHIFKSKRMYLLVSYCSNGQNGNGGHAHNDKLSFELEVDGKLIFSDPGTYLYTPNPGWRNKFRSVHAHNSIIIEGYEQNDWLPDRFGLFNLKNESTCKLLYDDNSEIILEVKYKDVTHVRHFKIDKKKLTIIDYCNMPFSQNIKNFDFYSNGYGKLKKSFYSN